MGYQCSGRYHHLLLQGRLWDPAYGYDSEHNFRVLYHIDDGTVPVDQVRFVVDHLSLKYGAHAMPPEVERVESSMEAGAQQGIRGQSE